VSKSQRFCYRTLRALGFFDYRHPGVSLRFTPGFMLPPAARVLERLAGIKFVQSFLILKGETQVKLIKALILCFAALVAVPAFAQDKPSDTNMQILLEKVKADKKLVVAANMDLNDAEGKAFWPIYEAYQKDLQAINDRLGKTILAYADAYNKNTLTDDMAK
jgi:hypothetical protein